MFFKSLTVLALLFSFSAMAEQYTCLRLQHASDGTYTDHATIFAPSVSQANQLNSDQCKNHCTPGGCSLVKNTGDGICAGHSQWRYYSCWRDCRRTAGGSAGWVTVSAYCAEDARERMQSWNSSCQVGTCN